MCVREVQWSRGFGGGLGDARGRLGCWLEVWEEMVDGPMQWARSEGAHTLFVSVVYARHVRHETRIRTTPHASCRRKNVTSPVGNTIDRHSSRQRLQRAPPPADQGGWDDCGSGNQVNQHGMFAGQETMIRIFADQAAPDARLKASPFGLTPPEAA